MKRWIALAALALLTVAGCKAMGTTCQVAGNGLAGFGDWLKGDGAAGAVHVGQTITAVGDHFGGWIGTALQALGGLFIVGGGAVATKKGLQKVKNSPEGKLLGPTDAKKAKLV